jgi:hypothetical protein
MAKIKVRIPENASLVYEGRVYRASDELEVVRDDYAEQLLSAGHVVEVKRKKKSGTGSLSAVSRAKASGRRS